MDQLPLPSVFPELGPRSDAPGANWSPNVENARTILKDAYSRAHSVLRQEADPIRLGFHVETLMTDMLPILEAIERDQIEEGVPVSWLQAAAIALSSMVLHLQAASKGANSVDHAKIGYIEPITITRTGKRGRPRKLVDMAYLQEAMSLSRNISVTKLASTLGMERHTLSYYLKLYGVDRKFSDLTDADLDILVKTYKEKKPDSGVRYLIGFLRRHGIRIQKSRVHKSIHRVDRLGRTLRQRNTIRRRKYTSTRPNALWHCDGHHKLILWGIVIHGFVDGFCRTVTGMRASTNNEASTVLDVFLEAIETYGTPSRMRGDRGGENVDLAAWMIIRRGPNRASFMWGSSTHNTRIERMWVEIGREFGRAWRAFFTRLGRLHRLDRKDPHHLWLLHSLYMSTINADCRAFQQDWNSHSISGPDTNDQSPNDLRFIGQTEKGMFVNDEYDGVHPDILQKYYGLNGGPRRRGQGQTGAGHPPEENDPDWEDEETLEDQIAEDQQHNVRHAPVPVPAHSGPFPEVEEEFFDILHHIDRTGGLPEGYGMLEEEWEGGEYSSFEILKTGRKRKEMRVSLPDHIWRPRAERWVRALDMMMRTQHGLDTHP